MAKVVYVGGEEREDYTMALLGVLLVFGGIFLLRYLPYLRGTTTTTPTTPVGGEETPPTEEELTVDIYDAYISS